jgi:cytochrome c oxidase cbb3-type subunit 3
MISSLWTRALPRLVGAALLATLGVRAYAQHATAFDIDDGKRVYESSCANCHGPDGNLIAGIDFGRGVFRRKFSDDELAATIIGGIPNTPMPPNPSMSQEQALRIVGYLRSMSEGRVTTANGDPRRGRMLFDGKGECTDCHAVRGVGSPMGPDLSRIGAVRRAGELERSLLEPSAEVQPENRIYKVTLKSGGKPIEGRLLNRDTFTVQLIDQNDTLRSFNIADLAEHGFDETPMPSAKKKLSTQEIADVVSYLTSLRGETAP